MTVIEYDAERRIVSWETVPEATEYRVYFNDRLYATTDLDWVEVDRDTLLDGTIRVHVVPVGEGRYRSPAKSHDTVIRLEPSVIVNFSEIPPDTDTHRWLWHAYYDSDLIHVTLNPTITFYASFQTGEGCSLVNAAEYSSTGTTDIKQAHLFSPRCTYFFTLIAHNPSERDNLFSLSLYLYDILEYADTENPVLPEGMMMFPANLYEEPEYLNVYRAEHAEFQLSTELYVGGYSDIWYPTVFPGVRNPVASPQNVRFIYMRNTGGEQTAFSLEQCSAAAASDAAKNITLTKGWTILQAQHSSADGEEILTVSADSPTPIVLSYYTDEGQVIDKTSEQVNIGTSGAVSRKYSLRKGETLWLILFASDDTSIVQMQRTSVP